MPMEILLFLGIYLLSAIIPLCIYFYLLVKLTKSDISYYKSAFYKSIFIGLFISPIIVTGGHQGGLVLANSTFYFLYLINSNSPIYNSSFILSPFITSVIIFLYYYVKKVI